jgi:hypothetical protein
MISMMRRGDMSAYDILMDRGVTRLCHFTKFKSLTHIISSDEGILASKFISRDTKNITDKERYDGKLDHVCCSIQYPNSWLLKSDMHNNTDKLFNEWVVLYINLSILNYKEAKFCPCNASTDRGKYITNDVSSLFADPVSCKRVYCREVNMLDCCTTDGQAEILIKDNIPREFIIGIATNNKDVTKRIDAMLKTRNVKQIPIYIAPDVITTKWSEMIRSGHLPDETLYDCSKEG